MSCITLSSPPKPLSECSLSGCRKRTRLREKRARLYTVTCCTSLCSQPHLVSGPEGLFWGFLGHQMENKQTNKSYMKWDLSIGCGEGHVIPDVYHLSRLSFKGIEEQEEQKGRYWPWARAVRRKGAVSLAGCLVIIQFSTTLSCLLLNFILLKCSWFKMLCYLLRYLDLKFRILQ